MGRHLDHRRDSMEPHLDLLPANMVRPPGSPLAITEHLKDTNSKDMATRVGVLVRPATGICRSTVSRKVSRIAEDSSFSTLR